MMKYKIEYLPKAVEDLQSIVNYIINTLKSPQAASDFIDLLDETILKLENYPKFYEKYKPYKELEFVYRRIMKKNYVIFYTIIDEKVEIHRILYGKINLLKHLK